MSLALAKFAAFAGQELTDELDNERNWSGSQRHMAAHRQVHLVRSRMNMHDAPEALECPVPEGWPFRSAVAHSLKSHGFRVELLPDKIVVRQPQGWRPKPAKAPPAQQPQGNYHNSCIAGTVGSVGNPGINCGNPGPTGRPSQVGMQVELGYDFEAYRAHLDRLQEMYNQVRAEESSEEQDPA